MPVPPPKETFPKYKVDELFWWLRYIYNEAWVHIEKISVDKQTCKMQGKSEFKTSLWKV